MSAFKPGDKVLVEATVTYPHSSGAWLDLRLSDNAAHHGTSVTVQAEFVHPVPEPPDPELRPGMVVAAVDPTDDREWWVAEGADRTLRFVAADGGWFTRDELDCARLRIVHPQVNP